MEIIPSNKGSSKLCYEGYSYTKKKTSTNTIRWKCSKRSSLNCKGCLTSDIEMTQVTSAIELNHESDPFQIAAMKAEIKASVEVNRGKSHQIVTDKLCNAPVQVRAAVGQTESLKRQVRRIIPRQKNQNQMALFHIHSQKSIPKRLYEKTISP